MTPHISSLRPAPYLLPIVLILSLILPMVLPIVPAHAETIRTILIEEVAWAGSSASTADEWIEIANVGTEPVSLAGWSLLGAGTSGKTIFLPEDATIPSQGTYLVANYPSDHASSALQAHVQLATTTVSLSNSALGIELRDANNLPVDRAGDGTTPFAGSSTFFASMIRLAQDSIGDQENGWVTATTSVNFKTGVQDFGTPGFCDLCETEAKTEETATTSTEQISSSTSTTPIIETTTSPSDIIETTTSTSDLLNESSTVFTTTSTQSTSATSTSTTFDTNQEQQTEPSGSASSQETSSNGRQAYTLNEVVSNPASGSEWVEIYIAELATETNRTLTLFDGQGKIASIEAGTAITLPHYLVVHLKSARLNNSGDSVYLRESDGTTTIDWTTIPQLIKGESWALDSGTWKITTTPTPGSSNTITLPTVSVGVTKKTTEPTETATTSTVITTSATSTSVITTTSTISLPINRMEITLSEIVSNPLAGPEWIELLVSGFATTTDRDLSIFDSQGRIATVASGTQLTSPHYLVIPLSSAKLNNSGDEASLREMNGIVLDATTIPKLAKGESWARDEKGAWYIAKILTPGTENTDPIVWEEGGGGENADGEFLSDAESLEEILAVSEASNSVTTSKTSSSLTKSYPFSSMFDSNLNGARVRLIGTVASIPRLLGASHTMVLHAEDGRGIIVYLPSHLNLPALGATVMVDGTLSTTYQGPELRMKKTDVWISTTTSTPPVPRAVDFLAPSAEDSWSLVETTGTIATVGTTSFTLQTEDGIDILISVPSVIGFRTKRLVKGDTVHIAGLVNIRKDNPTIIARSPDEITITSHASGTVNPPTTQETKNHVPGWTPFASAGGAIALTGGAKRFREVIRKRKLERLVKK